MPSSLTRKDLELAAPGVYLVRCSHPKLPQPDDVVLEGPLPDATEDDRKAARNKAHHWQLRIGHPVELVSVLAL